MAYYSAFALTPSTDAWIPDYLPVANKLVAKHGGKYLARTACHERVEGSDAPAALRIILEWPSIDAAKAFINDPDYAPHLNARSNGSDSAHFLIDGKDEFV